MKGVACERGGHDPLVVRFVKSFVHARMMQTPVDPIHEKVGEENEKGKLQDVIQSEWRFCRRIVHLGISFDLCEEEGHGQNGH